MYTNGKRSRDGSNRQDEITTFYRQQPITHLPSSSASVNLTPHKHHQFPHQHLATHTSSAIPKPTEPSKYPITCASASAMNHSTNASSKDQNAKAQREITADSGSSLHTPNLLIPRTHTIATFYPPCRKSVARTIKALTRVGSRLPLRAKECVRREHRFPRP